MARGYLIGEGYRDRIDRTITRVDGLVDGSAATQIPTRLQEIAPAPGDTPRLAAYARTAVWAKGKTMAVTFYTHSGTAFGLSSSGTAGTATALNISGEFLVLPNGDTNEAIGPTPTMTWCIIGKSRGGGNVALEAQQPPIRLAAYDITEGPWGKGERRNVAFYDVVGGSIVFSGVTATAGNVSQTFYPMATASSGTAVGPTPTMAWAVVSESPSGHLLAVEAENDPVVRLATAQSPGQWQRGSLRTVQITGTTRTEDVYSNFDYYSELDLPQGLVYAKTAYAPAGGTANVVIGPPPVPMHNAVYTASGDWLQGQTKQVSIPPSDGVTHARTVDAVNVYFEKIEGGNTKMAIGKFGTAYQVISTEAEPGSVKTAQRTNFGDKDTPWGIGSRRNVTIVGTTQTEEVISVFDSYSHLDMRKGLAVAKAKDPEDAESTAYIVISPAPRPLHQATTKDTGEWGKDEEKVLTVPAGDGRTASLDINVTNKFFDSISLDGKPIAVGKFGDQYCALSGGEAEGVKTAQRTNFGDKDEPWDRGSRRNVTIVGTTQTEEVVSVFDTYSHLDMRKGLTIAKGRDPEDSANTAYIVISPAPRELHRATTTQTGSWAKDDEKVLTVPAGDGRPSDLTINVTNKFFETIDLEASPFAIGKFGAEYFALTGGESAVVKLADRAGTGQWEKASQQGVKIQGTTTEVQAYNLVGHYEPFDGRGSGGVPGVMVAKGKDLGGASGTAYYLVSPPPIVFATGSFSGTWGKGESKSIQLDGLGTSSYSVDVQNDCFPIARPTNNCKVAVAKKNSSWHLVAAEFETSTAVFIRSTVSQTVLGTASTSAITFVGTGATSKITYYDAIGTAQISFLSASSTSQASVVTNVQASLNTQTCAIGVTLTTQTFTSVSASGTQTATIITSVEQKTAAIVSVSGTQTATTISMSGTQTMTFVTGTFTATFLRIKDQ